MLPAAACMRSHAASFYLLEMRKSRQRWAAGFLSRITMGLKRGGPVFRLVDFPLFSGQVRTTETIWCRVEIDTCRKPVRGCAPPHVARAQQKNTFFAVRSSRRSDRRRCEVPCPFERSELRTSTAKITTLSGAVVLTRTTKF